MELCGSYGRVAHIPFLSYRVWVACLGILMNIFKTPQKPKVEKLAKLTQAQREELFRIAEDAIASFKGVPDELESALGMLFMGHHFGWKVIYLMHSKLTVRKYEKILNIRVRDLFPPAGPSAYRCFAYRVADAASNFWKVVSGEAKDVKIERKDRLIQ